MSASVVEAARCTASAEAERYAEAPHWDNWRRGFIIYPGLHTTLLFPRINNNRERHFHFQVPVSKHMEGPGEATEKAKTGCFCVANRGLNMQISRKHS